jgi:hypothetical protein
MPGEFGNYRLWWHCPRCIRFVAVPLAPFIIRWGPNASSDMLSA